MSEKVDFKKLEYDIFHRLADFSFAETMQVSHVRDMAKDCVEAVEAALGDQ